MTEKRLSMRPSRVLRKLRAGEAASCFKINMSDARVAEIAALSGFDCVWVDLEHIANDWSVVERMIWAAKSLDVDVAVRVSRGSYSDHVKPPELDAAGIFVPHVMSLEDAQRVVQMTRFHPMGRRPVDSGNADGAYAGIDFMDYIRQANEQRFLCLQIEDPEVLDDIEAIAALDGVDMLILGPADLSQGIGTPGVWDHPLIEETRRRVAEACVAHGKFAAAVGTPDDVDHLLDLGYRFINVGADMIGLGQYCRGLVTDFRGKQP